jgi:uncharacterized protein YqfB (UPF0267 family)
MDKIVFSYNWNNKLAGIYFTSLRLRNDQKYILGKTYEICIRKKKQDIFFCYATLMDLRNLKLPEINQFIAGIDTGYSTDECRNIIKTMYKNSKINWDKQQMALLLFRKNDKNTPAPNLQFELDQASA